MSVECPKRPPSSYSPPSEPENTQDFILVSHSSHACYVSDHLTVIDFIALVA
jgi:hypothetical protein